MKMNTILKQQQRELIEGSDKQEWWKMNEKEMVFKNMK